MLTLGWSTQQPWSCGRAPEVCCRKRGTGHRAWWTGPRQEPTCHWVYRGMADLWAVRQEHGISRTNTQEFSNYLFQKTNTHLNQTIHKHLLLFCDHGRFCPMTQGWSTFQQVEFPSTGLIINNASKNKQKRRLQINLYSPKFSSTLLI